MGVHVDDGLIGDDFCDGFLDGGTVGQNFARWILGVGCQWSVARSQWKLQRMRLSVFLVLTTDG